MADKKYTAREAGIAVLKKAEDMMKAHKHIGWGKLHGKLEREGYSEESADKIAGAVKAKVHPMGKAEGLPHKAAQEQNVTPPDAVQKTPDVVNQPTAEDRMGGNAEPGTKPSNLKGPVKLAKFVGRMEHKRSQKAVHAATQAPSPAAVQPQMNATQPDQGMPASASAKKV